MTEIHPLACVEPGVELGEGVRIGPFCYLESGVKIGDETILDSHVTIKKGAILGARNKVASGAVLGGEPQDRKFAGEESFLKIGNDNLIREYVTIHRATGEGAVTTVGDHCFLMAYCHLGHNVTMHDHVTMANGVGVAGHVTIEEYVTVGGMVGFHQFARVGKYAMVGAMSRISRDAPPFMLVEGEDQEVKDINAVGLRRMGVSSPQRLALHKACKLLYKSELGLRNAIETVRREVMITDEVAYLLDFEERRYLGKNGRGDQR